MRITDLLIRKRNGGLLSAEEISYIIKNYVDGSIPDYQISALLMAIYFQGMSEEETAQLTLAMANSGDTVDLSPIPGLKVDKHSTGGVADTTTLVLAPLVAAAGVPVAKMSGRGLGHTGGTIDKMESIPGLNTSLGREEFISQVKEINLAVVGQSGNLVPADKLLYGLRDVTGTIDSIPLIASSIMSKKIAAGAQAILLDVKTGSGAFMQSVENSFELAETMVRIGKNVGRETAAFVTDMNEPLGNSIGNALEVEEAIHTLQGKNKGPLRELCLSLGAYMLILGGQTKTPQEGYQLLGKLLDSGQALEKFRQMITAQGGNGDVVNNTRLLPQAKKEHILLSNKDGYMAIHNSQIIGLSAMILGAGRENKESSIDLSVGIKIHAHTGDRIIKGQPLFTLFYNDDTRIVSALQTVERGFKIEDNPVDKKPLIYGLITSRGREEWNIT